MPGCTGKPSKSAIVMIAHDHLCCSNKDGSIVVGEMRKLADAVQVASAEKLMVSGRGCLTASIAMSSKPWQAMADLGGQGKVSVGDLAKLFDTLLRATFAKLDKNKNAKVDVSELVSWLLAQGACRH